MKCLMCLASLHTGQLQTGDSSQGRAARAPPCHLDWPSGPSSQNPTMPPGLAIRAEQSGPRHAAWTGHQGPAMPLGLAIRAEQPGSRHATWTGHQGRAVRVPPCRLDWPSGPSIQGPANAPGLVIRAEQETDTNIPYRDHGPLTALFYW